MTLTALSQRSLKCISRLTLLVVLLPVAVAQAQNVELSINLKAEAVNIDGVLVWRVQMEFSPADLSVNESTVNSNFKSQCPQASSAIKNRILQELAGMAADEKRTSHTQTPIFFLIDVGSGDFSLPEALKPRGFFQAISSRLGQSVNNPDLPALQFVPTPPSGFDRPSRIGEKLVETNHDWRMWKIEFEPMSMAVIGYELLLQTKKAEINSDNGGETVPVNSSMREIADGLGITSLTPEEKAVPVTLVYAPEDLQRRDGTTRLVEEIVQILKRAAFKSFLVLKKTQIHPCQLRDASIDFAVKSGIEELFTLYGSELNTSSILNDENKELFGVSGLQFVDDVTIRVTPVADDSGIAIAPDRDQAIEELLNKKYKPRLLAQPGDIITDDILEKDRHTLYLVRSVTAIPKYSFSDGVLTYEVERRREVVSLALSAGGSYSPEESLNGSVAFSGDNLLRRSESISVKLIGGGALQKGQFKFAIPAEVPKQRRRIPIVFGGFNFDASYFHDSSQRLGNPPATRLSDQESTISSAVSFEYDSFSERNYVEQAEGIDEKRVRLHHFATTDLRFDVQNTDLKSTGDVPTSATDGRVAFPSLSLSYLATYDLKHADRHSGIAEIDFLFNASGQRGVRAFNADFDYRQYELSAGVQAFFGFAAPTDFFLRYQRGVGASSNETPIFRAFRLGGPKTVRGLEEGEVIGNSYAYDRTEFGIGFFPLLHAIGHLFPRKEKTDQSGNNGAEDGNDSSPIGFGGLDLTNTYVKVFYDRGRTFDSKSLGSILNPAHGVKGFGVGVELRGIAFIKKKRANLSIGYAHSPDSILHRRGVLVTGLSLDF